MKTRRKFASWITATHVLFNATVLVAFTLGYTLLVSIEELEAASDWRVPARPANIRVLAADGTLIGDRGDMGGAAVRIDALPGHVPVAFIAIEDRRFYQHIGVDPIGIVSAFVDNLLAGEVERGGSTITQQLAKNLFLTPEQTLERKLREALLALSLERRYSKGEILEMYLNRIYFGAGAYGIEAAAQRYFDKTAADLTIAEAALLAGLVKAPTRLNPLHNPQGAQERATIVLAAMRASEDAPAVPAQPASRPSGSGSAGYIADWVETLVSAYVGGSTTDLVIHTSIDPPTQALAENALHQAIASGGQSRRFNQGALVSMTSDGVVRALVGGLNYQESQFNRAVTARRQPGSTFKPFVYLAALEKGYTAATVADDAPFTYEGWSPRNSSRRYAGAVTLEYAFAHSLNTIAARLAIDVTPAKVLETAMRMGFSGPLKPVPSIALGTSEVSLLELTNAYAPFANGGTGVVPSVIERIETASGAVLYERQPSGPGRVIDPDIAASLHHLLATSWVTTSGRPAQLAGFAVAGKTGTSQEGRDALFVGYAGSLVTGVWLGNDDDSGTSLSGANVPLDVWYAFMSEAVPNVQRFVAGTAGSFGKSL